MASKPKLWSTSSPLLTVQDLVEASVYKVTPTKVFAYKYKQGKPGEIQTVQFKHASVAKHYPELIDPPPGYKVIGKIGPNYKGIEDITPTDPKQPVHVEPDSGSASAGTWYGKGGKAGKSAGPAPTQPQGPAPAGGSPQVAPPPPSPQAPVAAPSSPEIAPSTLYDVGMKTLGLLSTNGLHADPSYLQHWAKEHPDQIDNIRKKNNLPDDWIHKFKSLWHMVQEAEHYKQHHGTEDLDAISHIDHSFPTLYGPKWKEALQDVEKNSKEYKPLPPKKNEGSETDVYDAAWSIMQQHGLQNFDQLDSWIASHPQEAKGFSEKLGPAWLFNARRLSHLIWKVQEHSPKSDPEYVETFASKNQYFQKEMTDEFGEDWLDKYREVVKSKYYKQAPEKEDHFGKHNLKSNHEIYDEAHALINTLGLPDRLAALKSWVQTNPNSAKNVANQLGADWLDRYWQLSKLVNSVDALTSSESVASHEQLSDKAKEGLKQEFGEYWDFTYDSLAHNSKAHKVKTVAAMLAPQEPGKEQQDLFNPAKNPKKLYVGGTNFMKYKGFKSPKELGDYLKQNPKLADQMAKTDGPEWFDQFKKLWTMVATVDLNSQNKSVKPEQFSQKTKNDLAHQYGPDWLHVYQTVKNQGPPELPKELKAKVNDAPALFDTISYLIGKQAPTWQEFDNWRKHGMTNAEDADLAKRFGPEWAQDADKLMLSHQFAAASQKAYGEPSMPEFLDKHPDITNSIINAHGEHIPDAIKAIQAHSKSINQDKNLSPDLPHYLQTWSLPAKPHEVYDLGSKIMKGLPTGGGINNWHTWILATAKQHADAISKLGIHDPAVFANTFIRLQEAVFKFNDFWAKHPEATRLEALHQAEQDPDTKKALEGYLGPHWSARIFNVMKHAQHYPAPDTTGGEDHQAVQAATTLDTPAHLYDAYASLHKEANIGDPEEDLQGFLMAHTHLDKNLVAKYGQEGAKKATDLFKLVTAVDSLRSQKDVHDVAQYAKEHPDYDVLMSHMHGDDWLKKYESVVSDAKHYTAPENAPPPAKGGHVQPSAPLGAIVYEPFSHYAHHVFDDAAKLASVGGGSVNSFEPDDNPKFAGDMEQKYGLNYMQHLGKLRAFVIGVHDSLQAHHLHNVDELEDQYPDVANAYKKKMGPHWKQIFQSIVLHSGPGTNAVMEPSDKAEYAKHAQASADKSLNVQSAAPQGDLPQGTHASLYDAVREKEVPVADLKAKYGEDWKKKANNLGDITDDVDYYRFQHDAKNLKELEKKAPGVIATLNNSWGADWKEKYLDVVSHSKAYKPKQGASPYEHEKTPVPLKNSVTHTDVYDFGKDIEKNHGNLEAFLKAHPTDNVVHATTFGDDWHKHYENIDNLMDWIHSWESEHQQAIESAPENVKKGIAKTFGPDWEQVYNQVSGGSKHYKKPEFHQVLAAAKQAQQALVAAGLAAPKVPKPEDLGNPQSGAHLGGAGEKTIFTDKQGKHWLFKRATKKGGGGTEKPYAAAAQQFFSQVAQKVKPGSVPVAVTSIDGQLGTLQPLLPLKKDSSGSTDLSNTPPHDLSLKQRDDVASEHILDWLMSQHDTHGANLLRLADGRIVGIDKEQAFKYFPNDSLSIQYHPNEQYGENPPYYNKFWKSFADGTMDYDPKVLGKYFDSIDSISNKDYATALKPYAEALYPNNPSKQQDLILKATARKDSIRKDFEKFITGLYEKRNGKPGKFTFAKGWVEGAKASKTVMKKYSPAEWASEQGLSIVQKDFKTKAGVTDANKLTIKTPTNQPKEKLEKFLSDIGVQPLEPIKTGDNNHIAYVDRKAYEKAFAEKEVPKPIEADPEWATTYTKKMAPPPAIANAHELKNIHEHHLGAVGKRFTSDGHHVENQYLKVKKFVDVGGEPYYLFHAKLRPKTWEKISGGTTGTWTYPTGAYDANKDAVVENSTGYSVPTTKWKAGKSEIHLVGKNGGAYSARGSIYAKVRPKKGQSPEEAFRELMDTMDPDISKEVFRNPTDEEAERYKLAQLYWAVDPQGHDALAAKGPLDTEKLKEKLAAKGLSDGDFDKIELKEVLPGMQTHVLPGRYKKLAGGALRFFFKGHKSHQSLPDILRHGELGIHERNLLGISIKGGSPAEDWANGAGDSVDSRAVTDNGLHYDANDYSFDGAYQVILSPTIADRLDAYGYNSDNFGCTNPADSSHGSAWKKRQSMEDNLKDLKGSYTTSNEYWFRRGVAPSQILRVVTRDQATRDTLLKQCKQAGVNEVNGVPIEEFIVYVQHAKMQTIYDKFVKPLGF